MEVQILKSAIKESYGAIAKNDQTSGCCGDTACCSTDGFSNMNVAYHQVEGYQEEADLALGCGLPTEVANIQEGDTVVDLGAGAGNDVFVARQIVGEKGRVIGIDMTPEMVVRALQNNQKLGFKNVEFLLGDIENMSPISTETADVVISNCVMNLVPNKESAFQEVFRILKTGGHFSISDIVYQGALPPDILEAAEMYAGCVAGASEKGKYLGIIKAAGFKNIQIKKERLITLPDDLLLKYINDQDLAAFKASDSGIYSITVYADKLDAGACCEATESACCGSETKNEKAESACCGTTDTGCC
ncbi:MAG: arsenite S-adenosylmethyltransferase [Saprospiraceae bacterium]|nr:MAG: arsenite S-adenosylmethyltransferase [Saprospiraceae bacterium]